MNIVEHLLNQLYNIVSEDPKLSPPHRDMTYGKLDELNAWLTWLDVKARSGVIGEDNQKTGFPTQFNIMLEQFFEMADAHKDEEGCEVNVPGDPDKPLTVVVRAGEDDNDPHTYSAPSRNQFTPEETALFWEEADKRGWTNSLRAQVIRKKENPEPS